MNTEKTQELSVALKAVLDILLLFCFLSLKRALLKVGTFFIR